MGNKFTTSQRETLHTASGAGP